MDIATIAFFTVLLALAALFLGLSRRQRQTKSDLPGHFVRLTPQAQLTKLQHDGRYRGIRIESHCGKSARFAGREFEFETAPRLPVGGCEAAVCTCCYVGLPERRKSADRRMLTDRRASVRINAPERREKRPGRKADVAVWSMQDHL